MTVDNSQFARSDVIVLEANRAPDVSAIPFSDEQERQCRDAVSNKIAQYDHQMRKNPVATAEQQQHPPNKASNSDERLHLDNENEGNTPPPSDDEEEDDDAEVSVPDQEGATAPAPAAPVVEEGPKRGREEVPAFPKWVRVGERVCFSTVVSAVLIPSSQDLTAAQKRELWWQPTDYADFRVNYATHMHNPSIELEEQELEGSGPVPAVPVATNADSAAATATVEGVLLVAASPAPASAPLASRSVNPSERSGRRRYGNGGNNHKVGIGAGGGTAASSQEHVSKLSRQERDFQNGRTWSSAGPNHDHDQQYKAAPADPRRMGGGGPFGYPMAQPHYPPHMHQQFHAIHSQQRHQQPMMIVRGHPGHGHSAPGLGRRDGCHDPYLATRGVNINHHPQHPRHQLNGVGAPVRRGQQFFVNGNPSGVNCPPPQPRMSPAPHGYGYRHAAGGARNGGTTMSSATFSAREGVMAPHSAASVAGGSSQFSMWRSQLVFAPGMHMQ